MTPPNRARNSRTRSGFTLTEILLIVGILGLLIVIAMPRFLRARSIARARTCQENLQRIDSAKIQYGKENGKQLGSAITQYDLDGGNNGKGYLQQFPREPSGYMYVINPLGASPSCTSALPGHSFSEIGTPIPVK